MKEQICNSELLYVCDSLLQAYSSVIYIRVITNLGVKVNLICSKTKASAMIEITITRLELLSCILLRKLLQSVLKGLSLNIASVYCWSDSMIALNWIKNNKNWEFWIQNHVDIINKVVKSDNRYYISSYDNPADIATREYLPNSIVNNELWWFGPEFWLRNKKSWPKNKFVSDVTDELRYVVRQNQM